jgi:antitoxin YefM
MNNNTIFNIEFNIETEGPMVALSGTTVKNDFKNICDRVYKGEVIIISRPKDENVVLVSEREYAELEKCRRNAEYLAKIDRGIAQKEAGTMQIHELIEV